MSACRAFVAAPCLFLEAGRLLQIQQSKAGKRGSGLSGTTHSVRSNAANSRSLSILKDLLWSGRKSGPFNLAQTYHKIPTDNWDIPEKCPDAVADAVADRIRHPGQ